MTLDKLMEKTTIKFPRPLNRQETEELLELVTKELPGTVSYEVSVFKKMQSQGGNIVKEERWLSITGEIRDNKTVMASSHFETKRYEDDSDLVKEISFHKVPGWELSQYSPETRKLWDDVWRIARQYIDMKAPTPAERIPYKEETEPVFQWMIKAMHVGAPFDNIEELKDVVEKAYTGNPKIKKETEEDGTITYKFSGLIETTEHKCMIKVVGMPIPLADAHIHHAEVVVKTEDIDLLSNIIKKEFLKYEQEYNQREEDKGNPELTRDF